MDYMKRMYQGDQAIETSRTDYTGRRQVAKGHGIRAKMVCKIEGG